MTRPTVTQALAWRPAALHHLADGWDAAARTVHARVSEVGSEAADWSGSAAHAAHERMRTIVRDADEVARALTTAAVAARAGCDRIEAARTDLSTRVASAVAEGFDVADDGSVASVAGEHGVRAAVLARAIGDALDRLGDADADTARHIDEPFAATRG